MTLFEAIAAAFSGKTVIRDGTEFEILTGQTKSAPDVSFLYFRCGSSKPEPFVINSTMLDSNWIVKDAQ